MAITSFRELALRKTFSRLRQNCARLMLPSIAAFEIRSTRPQLEKVLEHIPTLQEFWSRHPETTSQLTARMSERDAFNLLREHWIVLLDLALTPKTPLGLAWFGIKNSLSIKAVEKSCPAFAEIRSSFQIELEKKGVSHWVMKSGGLVLALIL